MRNVTKFMGAAALGALALGTASEAQVWSDGFESYAPGSGILGQGGWDAWDGNAAWDSVVTNAVARTGSNSLDIKLDSDTVYVFPHNDLVIDCGQWRVTAWVYTPSDMSSDSYFLLLNEYNHGGPYQWSVSVHFSPENGTVYADWDNESLPLVTDRWMEMRVDIDLDNDVQNVYYGGDLLYTDSWADRISTGGLSELQCIDLYAAGATSQYYDDISLQQFGDCAAPCATLDVNGSFAGLPVEFVVTGGEAGEQYGIFYAFRGANFEGFNDCIADCGNTLGCAVRCLAGDFDRQVGIGRLDSNGEAVIRTNVPCAAGDKTIYFMVVTYDANGNICGSEVVDVYFVPC